MRISSLADITRLLSKRTGQFCFRQPRARMSLRPSSRQLWVSLLFWIFANLICDPGTWLFNSHLITGRAGWSPGAPPGEQRVRKGFPEAMGSGHALTQ